MNPTEVRPGIHWVGVNDRRLEQRGGAESCAAWVAKEGGAMRQVPDVMMLTPHGDPLGTIGAPEIGGQCIYVRELSAHLARLGLNVVAFTRDRGEGKPPVESICSGAWVERVPVGPRRFVPKEEIGPFLSDFARVVSQRLGAHTVIHSHFWDGAAVAQQLAAGRTWVHASHSLGKRKYAQVTPEERARHAERFEFEGRACQRSTWLVASTAAEAEDLVHLYGAPRERIRVIAPGVDTGRFAPPEDRERCKEEFGLAPGVPAVGTLGRLDPRKGFDLFMLCAERLLRRGLDVQFLLSTGTGSDASEVEARRRLERLWNDLGLRDRLRWVDIVPQERLPRFYGALDVFVLPSRYELFGIVMLEAMACGVPLVATDNGGPAEVIRPGVDGLLVDVTDVDALADAVGAILKSPAAGREMGAAGRQRVVTGYSWSASAERHRQLYGL
ncbi:MAG TPA: glycosyltransferase family 1 protein [Candidatus Acetothermia bacterium]|nr:glycosyltransferase family 1 protein [Candidatus Acetothermia bacterium]